jgi:NDP-sugar pyrophosphorylase family protein
MKAMILAAGLGSRLRPLTDQMPKALVPVGGTPLLEIVLRRLAAAGVRDVIVNTFHHATLLEDYLRARAPDGLRIAVSRETELLDTGGGLAKAAWFFDGGEPFFLHNADVVSGVDLRGLAALHAQSGALAVLSVRERGASRRFLFAADGQLVGWENTAAAQREWASAAVVDHTALAFDGIQVLSPRILSKFIETGAFSLTKAYLRLAGAGERILAHRSDTSYWADIGSAAKLQAVEEHVARAGLPA